jgi:hypothetical protein
MTRKKTIDILRGLLEDIGSEVEGAKRAAELTGKREYFQGVSGGLRLARYQLADLIQELDTAPRARVKPLAKEGTTRGEKPKRGRSF